MNTKEINESVNQGVSESSGHSQLTTQPSQLSCCPQCHPQMFDASFDTVPVPVLCDQHAAGPLAPFFAPESQGKDAGDILRETKPHLLLPEHIKRGEYVLTHAQHNAHPRGRF